jgi:hypothetical protein
MIHTESLGNFGIDYGTAQGKGIG